MNLLLIHAIKNSHRIRFSYNDRMRVGEPQCYGISTAGKELARVYIREARQPESLFEVPRMEELTVLNEVFTKPGPNYKKGDSAMKKIFAEL